MKGRLDHLPILSAIGLGDVDGDTTAKIAHDRYEVYVNGEFVGYKTLFNQSEEIIDLQDFLDNQGFSRFTAIVNGDRYEIEADNDSAERIQRVLSMYLQQR